MPEQDVTHFTTVDRTSDPGFFLNFLDQANKIPGVSEWKAAILGGFGTWRNRLTQGKRAAYATPLSSSEADWDSSEVSI